MEIYCSRVLLKILFRTVDPRDLFLVAISFDFSLVDGTLVTC